ncbi:MAG: ABC-2 transporter permease [Acidobacteriota bacterium]|nr:ABC-2 transporter permease [Acidobacteriota bacterium]
MNLETVSKLVAKDWHLHRRVILLTVAGVTLAFALVFAPGGGARSIGFTLAPAMLISVIFYLPLSSVLGERDGKTITFLMGLPITPSEYVASKIFGNLLIFLLPWLAVVTAIVLLPEGRAHAVLATGFVPVVLVGFVLAFSFVLGFALITESGGWTVALIVGLLLLTSNVAGELVPDTPAVRQAIRSIAERGSAFYATLAVEVLLIALILASTFAAQARKKHFL